MKWFCSSSLCYNNVNTKKEDGTKIKYYSLPKNENLQVQYQKILKTKGMNWKNGQICCKHWSSGNREHLNSLPDVVLPPSQYIIHKNKYNKCFIQFKRLKEPTPFDEQKLK